MPLPPALPSAPPPATPAVFPDPTAGSLSELLKTPDRFANGLSANPAPWGRVALSLVATAVGAALFGFAAGCFAGWQTALLDAAKGAGIALFAFALCLPSLYVFACVGGTRLAFPQIVGAGAACAATGSLLLAALAPVVWLFAVSTTSAVFVTLLCVLAGCVGTAFSLRPARGLAAAGALRSPAGMRVWFAAFALVALQSVTLVRPMLAPRPAKDAAAGEEEAARTDDELPEKCFFLTHFFWTVDHETSEKSRR